MSIGSACALYPKNLRGEAIPCGIEPIDCAQWTVLGDRKSGGKKSERHSLYARYRVRRGALANSQCATVR